MGIKKHTKGKTTLALTGVELELMTLLWRLGEGSVAEVQEALPPGRTLAYTSVSTMLRILEQKQFAGSRKEGRGHIYFPLLAKADYEAASVKHLVKNVFDGTASSLVKRLVEHGDLSASDLEEIKKFLEEKDETMIWLEPIRLYLEMNALLVVSLLAFRGCLWLARRRPFDAKSTLRAGQFVVLACVILPLVIRLVPRETLLAPSAQIFSGLTGEPGVSVVPVLPGKLGAFKAAGAMAFSNARVNQFLYLLLAGFLLLGLRLVYRVGKILVFLRALHSLKRLGRVSLLVSSDIGVPFSAGFGYRAFVVLPTEMLATPESYRIAAKHELQHLRQRDIEWLYLEECLRILFFLNPAIYGWSAWFHQFQEFACDSFLIRNRKVAPLAYGRCLLRAAQSALKPCPMLVGTASMAATSQGKLLKRRIEMIVTHSKNDRGRLTSALLAIGTLTLVASTCFASRSLLQESELSLEEVKRLVVNSTADDAGIPLVVNEEVLKAVNSFLGTPKGRQFIKNSLLRMPAYMPLIERKIADYQLPWELVAIPLVESGYVNQTAKSNEESLAPGYFRGAGLWMFIEQTGRRYGLIINDVIDERLDIERETDAGMRYLRDLHGMFKNWELAMAAYNQGEHYVKKQIKETGINDAWELTKQGKINDYLSKVMAAMIIIKSPALHPR